MRNRAAHAQKRCSANKEIFDLKAIRRAALRIARGLNFLGSDYVSGARTNYRNSMCPASGYVTARKNCCKPICPAPGKTGGSDCVLYIICPASVDVT